ncbi:hypothetical protein PVAG01_03990 [Phlyctema vagabunda]|uniref:Cell wall proline rich protein n=1 Tax=Phlyctema vagabunda TaxID=108571 RepID=A0ABR4PN14_9HELO
MATALSTTGHHSLGSMSFTPEDAATINATAYHSNPANAMSPTASQFPEPSPRLNSPSAALPDFVFPSRASPSSAPSSFSRASGRRPMSAYELGGDLPAEEGGRRARPSPLPDFSFNSTNLSAGLVSPPQSPVSPHTPYQSMSARAGGHRRGISELHGGDAANGASLLSSSPTRPTAPSSLGPSAGRKGHSHRRSAAISSHDLSFLLKPSPANAAKIGGSAPASPSDCEQKPSPFPSIDNTVTAATTTIPDRSADSSSLPSPSGSPGAAKNTNRNRVGFSDTLEFIPRPLSVVSSDTSSTVRGHSVSGSLSSVISHGTAASPVLRDQRSAADTLTRPRTAGSVLDSTRSSIEPLSQKRSTSTPMLLDLSASLPTTPAPSTPKWGFFSRSGESSPIRSRPASSASTDRASPIGQSSSAPCTPSHVDQDLPPLSAHHTTSSRRASVSSRKSTKKQKKVKSWAGSILSRKSRPRSQKQKGLSRRSPTPPLRSYSQSREGADLFALNQAVQSDAVAGVVSSATSKPELQTDFANWKPRAVRPQDDDTMSPIIDLDAALGPFNTPSAYDAEWDASQKGSASSKRRMHSAAGMGGFMGPGMHYHRRAESAPEMVPFDNPRFGLHRLGSSSTMADVFEEDEEDDDWEDAKGSSDKGDNSSKDGDEEESISGIDIKVVDAENPNPNKVMDWTVEEDGSLQRGVKRKGSGLSEGERRQVSSSMKSEHSSTSLTDEPIMEESPTLEAPEASVSEDPVATRPVSRRAPSSESTTTSLHPRTGKDLAPVEVQPVLFSQPFLTPTSPNSTIASPFPSPRSPYSYDTQRISTAPSSIMDEQNYESLLLGEPGPEYRMSVDETPSIGSSVSTLTRENVYTAPELEPQFRDGQRSASLSSAAVTRKRSSMASLSRLINSSHGERSKLSIESRPASAIDADKKEKESKGKRISRMMQFWKPKEST